ncbi:hypothetical protein HaLaN_32785, partial [Haematococcus lacustris]|jgi:hypothetical protein
MTSD